MNEDDENKFNLTPKQNRIIQGVFENSEDDSQRITYSHSTMCQTSLPFKNMGDLREWKNRNGDAVVLIEAGSIYNPLLKDTVKIGLPYGVKPRLVLLHLNSEAVKQQSPEIVIEDTLHAFIKRLGLDANGRDQRTIKDQLGRLAASHLTIGRTESDGTGSTSYGRIINRINVWFPKDKKQRILWPNIIKLSDDYFQSLVRHAVPLDENALHLLKDSALELDLYAMLAERLHRIRPNKPHFVPWAALFEQYGGGYSRLRDFRGKFLKALINVKAVYPDADIENTTSTTGRPQGLTLFHSKPPILKKNVLVHKPDDK